MINKETKTKTKTKTKINKMKPIYVGITMRYKRTNDSEFGEKLIIPKVFVDILHIINNNLPIILFPITNTNNIDDIATLCNAVILTGSSQNIDTKYYDTTKPFLEKQTIDEYAFTKDVIQAFESKNKGILGICYGAQALNVYYGGTLHKVKNHNKVNHFIKIQNYDKNNIVYDTIFNKMYEIPELRMNKNLKFLVNSYHNETILDLAPSLQPLAISEDGIVEMFQHNEKIIGIQFHPEIDFKSNIFSKSLLLAFFRTII